MVGGTLAPHVPWQVMVYIADSILDGGYAGGALISDRWILTAGRNLFVNKSRQHIQGKNPIVPKVYLGISQRAEADEVAVEKVRKNVIVNKKVVCTRTVHILFFYLKENFKDSGATGNMYSIT